MNVPGHALCSLWFDFFQRVPTVARQIFVLLLDSLLNELFDEEKDLFTKRAEDAMNRILYQSKEYAAVLMGAALHNSESWVCCCRYDITNTSTCFLNSHEKFTEEVLNFQHRKWVDCWPWAVWFWRRRWYIEMTIMKQVHQNVNQTMMSYGFYLPSKSELHCYFLGQAWLVVNQNTNICWLQLQNLFSECICFASITARPDLNEYALSDDAYANVDGACNAYMALTKASERAWPEPNAVGLVSPLKGNILCVRAQFGRQWSVQRNMFKLHRPIWAAACVVGFLTPLRAIHNENANFNLKKLMT